MKTPTPQTESTTSVGPSNTLPVFMWRYITGNHLDGNARTDAGWFTRGTSPAHHVNWWSAKPRAHRMIWRWAIICIPTALILAYKFAHTIKVNLTILIGLAILPFLFHHGTMRFVRLIPKVNVVYVHDTVTPHDINTDYDDITVVGDQNLSRAFPGNGLPDLSETDITDELDKAVKHAEESIDVDVSPIRRTGRRA
jgi:hypothetical protein